ncbi:HPr-rel-A system PqqD family peptide chaperone [Azohydromonas australica]|uniref:HPr-rel-A system PqqD family peptide chaperone n=1 Tax=Azohydromonas australica TaxID=364039 RepID=UPI0003FBED76|nr:HPr-rel-A system PqqD family peptide chaperone [Azohydromonas australica]
MAPCYAAPAGTLHWRRWDDEEEMVVFDTASGSTHLLSPAAAEVLLALLEAAVPQDAAQLAQRLLPGEDGVPPDARDVRALQAVLADLARLDLVLGCDGGAP